MFDSDIIAVLFVQMAIDTTGKESGLTINYSNTATSQELDTCHAFLRPVHDFMIVFDLLQQRYTVHCTVYCVMTQSLLYSIKYESKTVGKE